MESHCFLPPSLSLTVFSLSPSRSLFFAPSLPSFLSLPPFHPVSLPFARPFSLSPSLRFCFAPSHPLSLSLSGVYRARGREREGCEVEERSVGGGTPALGVWAKFQGKFSRGAHFGRAQFHSDRARLAQTRGSRLCRGTSLTRTRTHLGPHSRPMPEALRWS